MQLFANYLYGVPPNFTLKMFSEFSWSYLLFIYSLTNLATYGDKALVRCNNLYLTARSRKYVVLGFI